GIWPNAEMHEREVWELFGIYFKGNHMLKPLFMEDWSGPPPLRKDFDLHGYVGGMEGDER
ncbi:MAG: NADH-quinone oxidoreductase subunit C, partial [Candidatus Odinarchaeota archaeon]|nr:NADH-quinone oxidoreductase subunit C [Candidatus Odinarchaeota archaeon]